MKAVVWNMAQDRRNWNTLAAHGADIAMVCEAPPPPPARVESIANWRTRGLDCPHVDEAHCTCRPWSTAIVSRHPLRRIEDARISRGGRQLNYGPSRPGSWIAGVVNVPGLAAVTAISLYGLLDEKSDASNHRSLSELAPVFDRRRYNRLVLLGGDLNTLAIAGTGTASLAKDQGVLDRITKGFGLVDLLERNLLSQEPPRGRLPGCVCSFGERCTHTWTHQHAGSDAPYQDDYLFASPALAERLEKCTALDFADTPSSDHAPIIATFA